MDECVEQLLAFNDLSQEEKDLWPHTGHWFFVPFNPVGDITQEQINAMIEAQNYFLENQKSMAVTGFAVIKHHVPDPDIPQMDEADKSMEGLEPPTVAINVWMLRKRALDGSKLVTSIERGPRGVHYFCTTEEKVVEMKEYTDRLDDIIRTEFGYDDHFEITDGSSITRKFCRKEVRNAGVASKAFTQFLSNSPATGKDYTEVDNCWKRKPKLDYLVLDEMKKNKKNDRASKTKQQGATKKAMKSLANTKNEDWAEMDLSSEDDSDGEDDDDAFFDDDDAVQPENHDDGTVIIQELAQRLDAAEKQIENHQKHPMGGEGDKHTDLLKTILERTAKLEAQRTSSTPKEVI
eukprot:5067160-Ditylum_brightwellii.AAC.1